MIAPKADATDGLIEYVRWAPVGRLRLLSDCFRDCSRARISIIRWRRRAAVKRVEFDLDGPVNAMVDGEILRLQCQSLEILPGALDVVV